MGYATFQQAKAFIEPGYGDCDQAKLGKAVNMIRQHFFNWYQELSLFLDAVECFQLQRFPVDCNDCGHYYRGITLPRGYGAIEALWWNDWAVDLQSSWREWQVGLSHECDCKLQKFDLPGTFPTFADIDPAAPQRVRVRAVNEADIGKRFLLRGTAATGEPFEQEFTLSTELQESKAELRGIKRGGGVVKDRTEGRVILVAANARMLGIYEPDDTVPSYRRIKVTGAGMERGSSLNVRANRTYVPLYDDDDVVETDNEAAFDAMARYLRLFQKASKTSEDMRNEQSFYATAVKMMMGEKAREAGKGTAANVVIKVPGFGGGRRLNRTGGGYL